MGVKQKITQIQPMLAECSFAFFLLLTGLWSELEKLRWADREHSRVISSKELFK